MIQHRIGQTIRSQSLLDVPQKHLEVKECPKDFTGRTVKTLEDIVPDDHDPKPQKWKVRYFGCLFSIDLNRGVEKRDPLRYYVRQEYGSSKGDDNERIHEFPDQKSGSTRQYDNSIDSVPLRKIILLECKKLHRGMIFRIKDYLQDTFLVGQWKKQREINRFGKTIVQEYQFTKSLSVGSVSVAFGFHFQKDQFLFRVSKKGKTWTYDHDTFRKGAKKLDYRVRKLIA